MKTKNTWILTGVSLFGLGMTAYQTYKGTLKASYILNELEDDATTGEKALAVLPCYIPALLSGLATATCIFSTNLINARDKAALAGAYSLIENQYNNYVDGVKHLYGEEAHQEVVSHIIAEKTEDKVIWTPELIGCADLNFDDDEEEHLYYLEILDKFFTSTNNKVVQAEYHFNRNFTGRGSASVAELLDFLGVRMTDAERREYEQIGWDIDSGIYWVDFDHGKTTELDVRGRGCPDGIVRVIAPIFAPDILEEY